METSEITDFLTDQVAGELTIERLVLTLLVTFIVAMFIYLIYWKTFKGVLYTRSFNIGLVMTALVTALIIMPITTNIILSLGMLGALSIIRFRTAIKDPVDIIYTFWAIAVGITCGAGFFMVAIVGSGIIGVFVVVLTKANLRGKEPYLLVVHYTKGPNVEKKVQRLLPPHKLRSRTVTAGGVELMLEVKIREKDARVVDEIMDVKGVNDAALVSYSGDYVP